MRIGNEEQISLQKKIGYMFFLGAGIFLLTTTPVRADANNDYQNGVAAHARGDVIAAIELLNRAADQGHVGAMVRLGYVLDKAEQNEAAFKVYSRAAESGSREAALALGVMYANGEGVRKNHPKALEWISRAAKAGLGQAVVTIAMVYLRGDLGVSPDRRQAIRWLKKGATAGYEPAKRELRLLCDGKNKKGCK